MIHALTGARGFCSSGRGFASGFLQIPSRDGHPCLQLTVPTAKSVEDFHLLAIAHAEHTKKWLTLTDATTYSRTGLNLKNLLFTNVNAEYSITAEKDGIVNGLIGNVNRSGVDASLDDITGNAFTDLSVTLKGRYDNDYLAGGGIIGIRSTGEAAPKNASASAGIGTISGNLFQGLNVTTTGSAPVDWSKNPTATTSSYIEGGGLIGVDAASSPADKTGVAEIKELSNNLFTDIRIRTDDILLGGGLVGVNNNSKHPLTVSPPQNNGVLDYSKYENDVSGTYSVLGTARGNVFAGVSVDVGYSLRGGHRRERALHGGRAPH